MKKQPRKLLFLIAILIFLPKTALCEALSAKQMELVNWMVFYYQNPEPNKFPEKLIAFSEAGILDEDNKQFPFLGFASTVFQDNPSRIKAWIRKIEKLPKDHKKIILLALWLSRTKESKDVFQEKHYKEIIAGENYYHFKTDNQPPNLDLIDPVYGGFLDIQWGRFLASGKKKYIRLVISTLDFGYSWGAAEKYSQPFTEFQKQEIIKEAHFKAALWSLQSNCKMHKVVKQYCLELYLEGNLSSKEKKYLAMILSKVYPDKFCKN